MMLCSRFERWVHNSSRIVATCWTVKCTEQRFIHKSRTFRRIQLVFTAHIQIYWLSMKNYKTSMSDASTNSWCLYLYPIFRDPRGYLTSVHRQPRFLVCATLWLRDVPSKHQVAPRQFLKCARLHYPGKHTLKHLRNKRPSSDGCYATFTVASSVKKSCQWSTCLKCAVQGGHDIILWHQISGV